MTDLEYIIRQEKKFYYTKWDDEELRKCVDMLQSLEHDELVRLFNCKWTKKVIKDAVFNILYMDKLGEREERFKEMTTNELINEFNDRGSGNVSLIRQELRHRYKNGYDDEKMMIATAFRNGSKGDQQWIEVQMRREMNGIK